ncbi:hypothetical protein [Ulvibacterium marinum]|uniref:Type II secretion system protein GspC N-terminal domain-containing protein n=1 Tax=Ulvibacterium marinum TaxID=2419782 RepID=A0A3B0CAX2_9FLAO|nr:hypothetical protein [Ulvibacterium marinum]RKN81814.1 hypothetical protein D7Z94_13085 [Ulvibacterium marinum]
MKKNQKTYLLLTVVLAIWGILGFKVIRTVNPDSEQNVQNIVSEKFKPMEFKERDTFSIVAHYRDPFLGTLPKSLKPKVPKRISQKKDTLPKREILYTGFIAESSSGHEIFFLTIDGHQQLMAKNEVFRKVKLLSGDPEKVKVHFDGKTKTIPLTQ